MSYTTFDLNALTFSHIEWSPNNYPLCPLPFICLLLCLNTSNIFLIALLVDWCDHSTCYGTAHTRIQRIFKHTLLVSCLEWKRHSTKPRLLVALFVQFITLRPTLYNTFSNRGAMKKSHLSPCSDWKYHFTLTYLLLVNYPTRDKFILMTLKLQKSDKEMLIIRKASPKYWTY